MKSDATFRIGKYCPFCGFSNRKIDNRYKPIRLIRCLGCNKLYRIIEYKRTELVKEAED
jgi:hypothetical protein